MDLYERSLIFLLKAMLEGPTQDEAILEISLMTLKALLSGKVKFTAEKDVLLFELCPALERHCLSPSMVCRRYFFVCLLANVCIDLVVFYRLTEYWTAENISCCQPIERFDSDKR